MIDRSPDAGWDASRSAAGAYNPWLVTLILSIATFMTVLDTSIANFALVISRARSEPAWTKAPGS